MGADISLLLRLSTILSYNQNILYSYFAGVFWQIIVKKVNSPPGVLLISYHRNKYLLGSCHFEPQVYRRGSLVIAHVSLCVRQFVTVFLKNGSEDFSKILHECKIPGMQITAGDR